MSDVKVRLDPFIGHPDDTEVTEWRIEWRGAQPSEWILTDMSRWHRWTGVFPTVSRSLVAVPVGRKVKPPSKVKVRAWHITDENGWGAVWFDRPVRINGVWGTTVHADVFGLMRMPPASSDVVEVEVDAVVRALGER